MEKLTKDNVEDLIDKGYLYLLGQTQNLPTSAETDILTRIILTPTKQDMEYELMPPLYDCYFNLKNDEAMDLVEGADAVEFIIK